jgi:hypothetical protein
MIWWDIFSTDNPFVNGNKQASILTATKKIIWSKTYKGFF